jgi:hypothetical protein
LNGTGRGLTGILYRTLPEGTEENQEKSSIRIAGVPVKIRIEKVPNTSPEHYRQTKLYGNFYYHNSVRLQQGSYSKANNEIMYSLLAFS